jgi:hypothetical protein
MFVACSEQLLQFGAQRFPTTSFRMPWRSTRTAAVHSPKEKTVFCGIDSYPGQLSPSQQMSYPDIICGLRPAVGPPPLLCNSKFGQKLIRFDKSPLKNDTLPAFVSAPCQAGIQATEDR